MTTPQQSSTATSSSPDIATLINQLSSQKVEVRTQARHQLISMGKTALSPMLHMLQTSTNSTLHWELIRALGDMRATEAIPTIVEALVSDHFDVRWVAAEVLISFGKDSLVPLLRGLIQHSNSACMRQSAHHILRVLLREYRGKKLAAVINALEHRDPAVTVPPLAYEAIQAIEAGPPSHNDVIQLGSYRSVPVGPAWRRSRRSGKR